MQASTLVKTFGTLFVSGEENAIQVSPSWIVLGVTRQTPFTYLAHVKGLNSAQGVGGGGGGGVGKILLRPCL